MLSDVVIETATIKAGNQEFEVSGLSFAMVARLFNGGDRDELQKAVEELEGIFHASQAGDGTDVRGRVGAVLAQLPTLAAKVIAVAADEPSLWERVMKFPVPLQLDALMEIGRLTFTGEDAVKNFVSGLLTLTGKTIQAVEIASQEMTNRPTALPRSNGMKT